MISNSSVESLAGDLGDAVAATLKWFNSPKGFGFVVMDGHKVEDARDAFLHITTLQRAGINALGDGACFLCRVEHGPKGAQVLDIIKLVHPGQDPVPVQCDAIDRVNYHDSPVERVTGTVKWYKMEKGFGFAIADDGKKDVFLHKSCLAPHKMDTLHPGTRILMDVQTVPKGREAVALSIYEG